SRFIDASVEGTSQVAILGTLATGTDSMTTEQLSLYLHAHWPELANIVLDELDWELERRGHRFSPAAATGSWSPTGHSVFFKVVIQPNAYNAMTS
ncbi:hypothetical protein KQ940_17430, partial [Marinobacterium sp. D7]|uniref:hypothetical protein n=1 Tax=Marinobacterium ramblicola TaxID=2849041 RepID=UPI001C2DABC3